jgi:hypothetical protein
MKRVVLGVLALVALVAGLVLMAELTQNRPDPVRAGSVTTVSFEVSTRDAQRGEPAAAAALWAVCSATVPGDVSAPEEIDGMWEVTIEPAIGEHGENRLVGCLEDVTLDRVMGHVVAVRAS